MGLETATYIADLNDQNPTPDDLRRQGDDHLRLIKAVLKNTFPNLDAQTLASAAEISYLIGLTGNIQAQLDTKVEGADIDLADYARFDTAQTFTKNQRIAEKDWGSRNGSLIVDCSLSDVHIITVTGNLSITLSNLSLASNLTFKIIQSAGGATVTLPSEMDFAYGVNPVLTPTTGKYDVIAGKVIAGRLVCGFLGEVG